MNPLSSYRIGWHSGRAPWWRGWRRPWQAEFDPYTFLNARRAVTRKGAERRMMRAVATYEATLTEDGTHGTHS
mgnify:CR=1 FL=1